MKPKELATAIVDGLLTSVLGKGDNLGIRKDLGEEFASLGGWCRDAAITKVEGIIRSMKKKAVKP